MAKKVKKSELKAAIRHYVFSGFYDASEVVKIIADSIFEGLDLAWSGLRIGKICPFQRSPEGL